MYNKGNGAAILREAAYTEGYKAGYEFGIFTVLDDIDDLLDSCAHDNGAMIVRALKELKERYGIE